MEVTATASTTGSRTIADVIPRSAAEHPELPAVRYKRDGAWHDVSYAQLADIVREVGLGLIDLGIEAGERICILANTRPEWSYADLGATTAGTVVVPIYQTNSPEECHWVLSDSEACAVVCENEEQLAKIVEIRDRLPQLRTIIVIDPPSGETNGSAAGVQALGAITLEAVRERGRLLRRRHQADHPRAGRSQTDLPAIGAARVREDLHARPRSDRGPAARGAAARGGGDQARREGPGHDQPRRRGARGAAQAV